MRNIYTKPMVCILQASAEDPVVAGSITATDPEGGLPWGAKVNPISFEDDDDNEQSPALPKEKGLWDD